MAVNIATPTMAWKIDQPCMICQDDFNDGNLAVVLGCGNNHVICNDCHTGLQRSSIPVSEGLVRPTIRFFRVPRNSNSQVVQALFREHTQNNPMVPVPVVNSDPGDRCPGCRSESISTLVVAKNYYSGRIDDPVIIN